MSEEKPGVEVLEMNMIEPEEDIAKNNSMVSKDELQEGQGEEEEVHVIYLNVPEGGEPQVMELSNFLAQEGIQVIPSEDSDAHQSIIIDNNSSTQMDIPADQSEVQSANALLRLATSHNSGGDYQGNIENLSESRSKVKVITEKQMGSTGEALMQLSSEQQSGTYIVSEDGQMIPISHSKSEALMEETGAEISTIAICQCWCGQEFLTQTELDDHCRINHGKKAAAVRVVNKCNLCTAEFSSPQELFDHQSESHQDGMPWECTVCQRRFSKKIGVKAHMRAHMLNRQYQCGACKKLFLYKMALARHMTTHQCEQPFKCTLCGEVFSTQWELRKHRMSAHQPQKLYQCDICTKTFKQRQTLFCHARMHTGQKPYGCEVCMKTFTLKSTLKQHKRIHTGEKPHNCPICFKGFRQPSTLKSHMGIHSHEKPHLCRYCKGRFATQEEVTEHEQTHVKNKNWQCDDCGMRFRNQSLLARHGRVHSNERPFQCKVCLKRFVQSGSLQAHMRSHTKEKPYRCRWCPKAYTTSGTLLIHIRKAHNVNAKKVKDVFPVYNILEDQKVFTIRSNQPRIMQVTPTALPSIVHIVDTAGQAKEHQVKKVVEEEATRDAAVSMENVLVEEVVETGEMEEDGDVEGGEGGTQNEAPPTLKSKKSTKGTDSSHSLKDRQEAALGLAELSCQGEGVSETPAAPVEPPDTDTKIRTFFKEETLDDDDPGVTKIILSKEGGVMNSQDPHQCPVCGRIFGRKSIMVEHVRIHTNEKPYVCDFCNAGFRQNAQLRSHIRNRHTKIERYQCSFCHKRFLSPNITIRHINFHHKLKVKFCESVDPSWNIQSAVWSDDQCGLTVKGPQVLKAKRKPVPRNPRKKKELEMDIGYDRERGRDGIEGGNVTVVKVMEAGNEEESFVEGEEGQMESEREIQIVQDLKESDREIVEGLKALIKGGAPKHTFTVKQEVNEQSEQSQHTADDNTTHTESVKDEGGERNVYQTETYTDQTETLDGCGGSTSLPVINISLPGDSASQSDMTLASPTQDHQQSDNSKLQCGTCGLPFRGISNLIKHLKTVHNTCLGQSDIQYTFVEEETGTESEHLLTKRTNTAEEVMELISGQGGTSKQDDRDHIKVVIYDDKDKCVDDPEKKSYPCNMCHHGFDTKPDLEVHMTEVHTDKEVEAAGLHRCDTCKHVMKNTQQVSNHIKKFHGVEKLCICSICMKEFYQMSSVNRHMKFFHKWEMKIRGEASIPVITKAAPLNIQMPTHVFQPRGKNTKLPVRVLTKEVDDVSYVSLEVGDLENLQIFRSDGQLMSYDVVNSTDKVKMLRIKKEVEEFENEVEQFENEDNPTQSPKNIVEINNSMIDPGVIVNLIEKNSALNTDIESESLGLRDSSENASAEVGLLDTSENESSPSTTQTITPSQSIIIKSSGAVASKTSELKQTSSKEESVLSSPMELPLTSLNVTLTPNSPRKMVVLDMIRRSQLKMKKDEASPVLVVRSTANLSEEEKAMKNEKMLANSSKEDKGVNTGIQKEELIPDNTETVDDMNKNLPVRNIIVREKDKPLAESRIRFLEHEMIKVRTEYTNAEDQDISMLNQIIEDSSMHQEVEVDTNEGHNDTLSLGAEVHISQVTKPTPRKKRATAVTSNSSARTKTVQTKVSPKPNLKASKLLLEHLKEASLQPPEQTLVTQKSTTTRPTRGKSPIQSKGVPESLKTEAVEASDKTLKEGPRKLLKISAPVKQAIKPTATPTESGPNKRSRACASPTTPITDGTPPQNARSSSGRIIKRKKYD